MKQNPQQFQTPKRLSKTARDSFGKYVKRIPLANEAQPPRTSIWELEEYVSTPTTHYRAGSEDALKIKSKGLST